MIIQPKNLILTDKLTFINKKFRKPEIQVTKEITKKKNNKRAETKLAKEINI